jgi:hypothetical protein
MDKHHVNEFDTAFVTFHVEGDPAPEVEWFKVPEKDMSCNPRWDVVAILTTYMYCTYLL